MEIIFYCNACAGPCTRECSNPCDHGIAKREFCDKCFVESGQEAEYETWMKEKQNEV